MRAARTIAIATCLVALAAGGAVGEDVRRYLDSATVLYDSLEYEKALKQIQSAKSRADGPDDEVAVALLEGIVLAELGREAAARGAFQLALSLSPEAVLPLNVSPKTRRLLERTRVQVKEMLAKRGPLVDAGKAASAGGESKLEAERRRQNEARNEAERLKQDEARREAERLKQDEARREAERLKQEQARNEAERLKQEQARNEAERLKQEQARSEAERLKQEQARNETERLKQEQARNEAERRKQDEARREAGRLKQEQARNEAERRRQERSEPAEESPPDGPRRHGTRGAGLAWIPAAAGAGFVAAGGYFLFVANDRHQRLVGAQVPLADAPRLRDEGKAAQTTGWILAGAGAAALSAAGAWWLWDRSSVPSAEARVGVYASGNQAGIWASVRWP